MKYVQVTLTLEPGDPKYDAAFFQRALMRPAFAPGDEPEPVLNIPAIGDFVRVLEEDGLDGMIIADVAGIKAEDVER